MTRLLFGAELPLHPGLWGVSGWSLLGFAAFFGRAAIFAGSCVCIPGVLAHVLGWGCGGTGSCVTRVPQDCSATLPAAGGRVAFGVTLTWIQSFPLIFPDSLSGAGASFSIFLLLFWGLHGVAGHHTLPPVRICSSSTHPGHLLHPQPFLG